jgi:hypothetical protein
MHILTFLDGSLACMTTAEARRRLAQDGFGGFFVPSGSGAGIGCGLVVSGLASLPAAGGGVGICGSTAAGGAFCIISPSPVGGGTTMAPDAAGSRGAFGPVCADA